ncbi:hypothetical protein [Microbacterium gorillae]|uniref:hypothetical protein n=1 Tax=Microbacterium gorillae TaxID=1231063 RepID=UPI00058C9953|nr:hypothetical protein [Microbacterium gorillae]
MSDKPRLRDRIREAGGLYAYVNDTIIKYAGPPTVGPYETEPPAQPATAPCPLCGHPMSEHEFDRTGERTLMHCPI